MIQDKGHPGDKRGIGNLPGVSARVADLRRLLDREAGLVVRRLREFTESRYAAAAPPLESRAAVARHLAQVLAVAAQGTESAGAAEEPDWRVLPELPVLALADAVALTANDLLDALASPPESAWTPDGRRPVSMLAAGMLAEVLLHRRDLDGSAPGAEATAAALDVLVPGQAQGPGLLFAQAQLRCPAYRPWRSD